MNPTEKHGDWRTNPSGRSRNQGATMEGPAVFGAQTRESPRGSGLQPLELPQARDGGWVEAIRGLLFFGILATVVWLEWIAIKAITAYVLRCF